VAETGNTRPLGGEVSERVRRKQTWDNNLLRFSRLLWPRGLWLLWFVVLGSTALDYTSTAYALEFSPYPLFEGNSLARLALHLGGFGGLALWNILKIGIYIALAMAVKRVSARENRPGLGRFTSILLLFYYSLFSLAAAVNNLLLALP
jgi:hypothetical protein